MDKSQQEQQTADIASEKYRGPSTQVVAAGTGFIQHLKYAVVGLAGAFAFALIFPKAAYQSIGTVRSFADKLTKPAEEAFKAGTLKELPWAARAKNWAGSALFTVLGEGSRISNVVEDPMLMRHQHWAETAFTNKRRGFGHWFLSHIVGAVPMLGGKLREGLFALERKTLLPEGTPEREAAYRWINAITFGGFYGAAGYVAGWVKALFHGANHGNEGKEQFQRAQDELRRERASRSGLESKLDETQRQVEALNPDSPPGTHEDIQNIAAEATDPGIESRPKAMLDATAGQPGVPDIEEKTAATPTRDEAPGERQHPRPPVHAPEHHARTEHHAKNEQGWGHAIRDEKHQAHHHTELA